MRPGALQTREGQGLPAPRAVGVNGRSTCEMLVPDRELFHDLRRVLPAATKACLRETFGVSETTWVKLRDGRPIRRSTLNRVLDRYRQLEPKAAFEAGS